MLFLSDISGSFPVAATTFATHVSSPRQVGSCKLVSNNEPALFLHEVAFTAYYPADVSATTARKGIDWVLRPVKESLNGFIKFSGISPWILWPVVYLFGSLIQIPVYPNAPLARPQRKPDSKDEEKLTQWPLVIFSHGLGGSRTAYSQICSRLAASGRVVLAMEHRDGTGCACITRVRTQDGNYEEKPLFYYKEHDVILTAENSSEEATPLPLRTDQLEFRRAEIYTAYQSFVHFLKNACTSELQTIDNQPIDQTSWSYVDPVSNEGPVCFDKNVTLAGHSFGGCTVLSILSTNPPVEYMHIPVSHALILDPWLEPLSVPGPAPIPQSPAEFVAQSTPVEERRTPTLDRIHFQHPKRDSCLPRMLVINSETFTLWKDHYERLKGIVNAWEPEGRRLLTIVASKHASFSDFPLLPLIRSTTAGTIMNIFSRLSIAFLDNQLDEAIDCISTRDMEIQIIGQKKDGKPKRKLAGNVGDVVIT